MQSQFYGNIVTMSAFENRIDLAVYETCQRIKPQFWSHALALLSFCSREEEKTWRTRVKKRESQKFTHYFLLAKICSTRKRQTAKNTRFWFGILKLSLPFFPRSRFTQRRNTTVECWSFAFFVCLVVCVCVPILFLLPSLPFPPFDAYVLFATISTQTHSQTNSIYYSIYSGEYISHYCLYHWNATAIGSVYPGCYLYFAFFRFALVWRHNNVHSKLWKIFAKCHHQQLLQRIEDICFCFGFCFLLLCRRKRETFNIVNNIKLQWKCKKGGTEECLSICQYHNRRRNKMLHGEYSKQWRHHNNKSNDVRHIGYFTRSFILHLFFLSYAPFSNWFQSKVKSTAVFAISPKYIRTRTIENGRYI